ncbi:MAG: glycerol-3-phosphate dehydrogenase/oxidase, partial [Acidobacteriota bacterium]|nr:glycerol-3-phosphate dehydrogenase/oxidase [Acidobacteriota bacterium]
APHLVSDIPFVVPNYDWWEAPFYGIGLRLYDVLAGRHGFGASRHLSREETLAELPTLETEGLRGGILYYDGQFDDARLAICLARTAADLGATLVNYAPVRAILRSEGLARGVRIADLEGGDEIDVEAKVVVNATGIWSDSVRQLDDPDASPMMRPSQGVHVVLPRRFLPGDGAIMVPHTDDGRVLFAIPWHDRVVVGTTDTPVNGPSLEPRAQDEEIEFLLSHAARYLTEDPGPDDVSSVFAGIRPLVGDPENADSAAISRDHTLHISDSCLVTIAGGKWTTVRKMAQDTVDQAALLGQLEERPCVTHELNLHGYHSDAQRYGELAPYGADAVELRDLSLALPAGAERLHEALPYIEAEVIWAARMEMARTVEDVLARRTRALLLDAAASLEAAPRVASLLMEELGRDPEWAVQQVAAYTELAQGYRISSSSR